MECGVGVEVDFLADILGSKTKLKIMLVLFRYGQTGITRIVRETGLNYVVVRRSLQYLKEMEIIIEEKLDNYTIYKLNYDSPVVRMLKALIAELSRKQG